MKLIEIKKLMKQFGLKLTLPRLRLIEVFLSNDKAVTYPDLLRQTADILDKVTVYRTLKSFEDIGIIHRIIGANSSPSYAFSNLDREHQVHHKQHLHLSCVKCNGIYCLDEFLIPTINLPNIYEVHSLNMLVIGVCRKCNQNSNNRIEKNNPGNNIE